MLRQEETASLPSSASVLEGNLRHKPSKFSESCVSQQTLETSYGFAQLFFYRASDEFILAVATRSLIRGI